MRTNRLLAADLTRKWRRSCNSAGSRSRRARSVIVATAALSASYCRSRRALGDRALALPRDRLHRTQLDGGDVHVWIQAWRADLLDGQPLSRVLHRREDEKRRSQVEMDDDDD
jgi:hypothetical protein